MSLKNLSASRGNMEIIEIIGILISIIGSLVSLWIFYQKIRPIRKVSWKSAQKAAKDIADRVVIDNFSPDLIVGIGRGGAIMAAMISGCLGHRPIFVIDRKYTWQKGRRIDDMLFKFHLPSALYKNVLLIAGETHTGNTMRLYYNYLKDIGAKEIRRASFYYQEGSTETVEYIGFESSKDILMPWMFTKRYIRDSRSENEAHGAIFAKSAVPVTEQELLGVCFLVRHGQSADNATGDRYSGITDSPLTEEGLKQAEEVGIILQEENIERIYVSPMKRAVGTARMIKNKAGGVIVIDRRIREIDYGDWEGLTRQEIFRRWPKLYSSYKKNPIKNFPPNAEKPEEAIERLRSFWYDLQNLMASESIKKIVLVTHKSIARLLLCDINDEPVSKYRKRRLDNASITKLVIERNGKTRIVYENQTNHISRKT